MPEHAPTPVYSRALYGYALFLLFKSAFLFYLFWIYTPHEFLQRELGLTFLPKKYFALFLPIILLVILWLFVFIFYPTIGVLHTPAIDSKNTITDSFSSSSSTNSNKEAGANYQSNKLKPLIDLQKFNRNDPKELCDCMYTKNCMKSSCYEFNTFIKHRKTNLKLSDIDIKYVSAKLYSN